MMTYLISVVCISSMLFNAWCDNGYSSTSVMLIEKVHLDDLDLYVITFTVLATSVFL